MAEDEMAALRNRCHEFASDGRYELFKTTIKYDVDIGREQQGFKSIQDMRFDRAIIGFASELQPRQEAWESQGGHTLDLAQKSEVRSRVM
jgi:hypothetical protein